MADARNVSAQGRAQESAGLSPRTVELVRKSWAAVMPISDAAASLFYERLFELDPSVRPLFKSDMREQKKKLMQTITVAVDGLANLEKLVPVLKALGARHAGYMVLDRHYDTVGEALLWTLKEGLGDAFNAEVKKAWVEVYGIIARVMKQAAAEQMAPKPENVVRTTIATPKEPLPTQRAAVRGAVVVGGGASSKYDSAPPDSTHPAGRTLVGGLAGGQRATPIAPMPAAAPAPAGAPVTQRTVDLVQESWRKVLPISDAAASLFYERLFELDPSVRPLFKNDMREQKKKLMQTITVAVDGLTNLPKLVPTLQALGARHAGYMVQDRHYDTVGAALLWTLKEGLGNSFNAEVEAAWTAVYGVVADVMKKAAHQQQPQAAPEVGLGGTQVFEEADTKVNRLSHATARASASAEEVAPPQRMVAPVPVAAPAPAAVQMPPIVVQNLPDNRPIILQIDGQSLPPLQVRVALETPSPYLNKQPDAVAKPEGQPRDGMAAGLLLGMLCLVFAMIAAGLVALASQKTLSPGVFMGVPLSALALAITAFALGYLWGKPRGTTDKTTS